MSGENVKKDDKLVMWLPKIKGTINRRILINFKIDLKVLEKNLPAPFKPISQNGIGIGGICLIRLKGLRPMLIPKSLGMSSENAAHRFAVYWMENGVRREGVYVPRRDSSHLITSLVGGRLFPGVQHYSKFEVNESNKNYQVAFTCEKDNTHLSINADETDEYPKTSAFESLSEVSEFFKNGSLGYSDALKDGEFDGIELVTDTWEVSSLKVNNVVSSYLDDERNFPKGSVEFDNALLMKNIKHHWNSLGKLK